MTSNPNVTRLLRAVQEGDQVALNQLFSLVYEDLRQRAHWQRGKWHGNLTLNTTALVHEAYIKLVDQTSVEWESRAHFLSVAAKAIRHILIDYARQKKAEKRGGDVHKVSLEELQLAGVEVEMTEEKAETLIAVEEALKLYEKEDARAASVVECRFFGGMTVEETATALNTSPRTVKRDWALAQAWLKRAMAA